MLHTHSKGLRARPWLGGSSIDNRLALILFFFLAEVTWRGGAWRRLTLGHWHWHWHTGTQSCGTHWHWGTGWQPAGAGGALALALAVALYLALYVYALPSMATMHKSQF